MRRIEGGQERIAMPRGDKSAYTERQKRQAEHIQDSEREQGRSEEDAERIAWATVNKRDGGGKLSGSGRKGAKKATKKAAKKATSKVAKKATKKVTKKAARKTAKKTVRKTPARKTVRKRTSSRRTGSNGASS
ncbi:hypothetical protein MNR01_16430 [Lysobacter sp. S4-A87]|uniref:hypothetical protein n=1 Tax=Lysobacter sp. S4-A87 TaxID=2925843 RepID=UPI001F53A221|nr:hypothetical protein [Lysobacter sp. S4-A87]UNK49289.1 hypothetical protein MNR01_16430 [Lysobacter sp. S4-A87]